MMHRIGLSSRDARARAHTPLSLPVLGSTLLRRKPFPSAARWAEAVPTQQPSFVSRSVADVAGGVRRVEVLVGGEWLRLADALELELLERCTGELSAREIAWQIGAEMAEAEGGEEEGAAAGEAGSVGRVEKEVEARLRHLYDLRLISMEGGGP